MERLRLPTTEDWKECGRAIGHAVFHLLTGPHMLASHGDHFINTQETLFDPNSYAEVDVRSLPQAGRE